MTFFWIFIWLVCVGAALFGEGDFFDWDEWSVGRKIAAFLALSPFIAVGLFFLLIFMLDKLGVW